MQATQEATRRIRAHFADGRSAALETVFSDSRGHKLALLKEARTAGFRTVLVFIGVDHPQISIARVLDRVEHGGHDVPDEIIEDRFPRCFDNLKAAFEIVDLTILIDNSGCYEEEGAEIDGSRHYVFGIIEHGGRIELSNPLPHWFIEFQVGAAISKVGSTD
jgi:predicted ABC-type ATPase